MAIHPQYADAILDGRKHVEFRKRALADDVRTVVVYATSPVKRIIGEFTVERVLRMSPAELWLVAGAIGGIGRDAYSAYFVDSPCAVGLLVGSPQRYSTAVPLDALTPQPGVPQSFAYLPGAQLTQIRSAARAGAKPRLTRLVGALAGRGHDVAARPPAQTVSTERLRASVR